MMEMRRAGTMTTSTERPLARLLQLASPTLPVGAYSYSQGLEAAIEAGIVKDPQNAQRWIADVLEISLSTIDAPLLPLLFENIPQRGKLDALSIANPRQSQLRPS